MQGVIREMRVLTERQQRDLGKRRETKQGTTRFATTAANKATYIKLSLQTKKRALRGCWSRLYYRPNAHFSIFFLYTE